jgi:hypothetical protein
MAKYKLTDDGVYDSERHLFIPSVEDNRHWTEYQEWLGQGNTPDPADPEPTPPTSSEVFDSRVDGDPIFKAWMDELESVSPGLRDRIKARMP